MCALCHHFTCVLAEGIQFDVDDEKAGVNVLDCCLVERDGGSAQLSSVQILATAPPNSVGLFNSGVEALTIDIADGCTLALESLRG